jgi:hypothetical protein
LHHFPPFFLRFLIFDLFPPSHFSIFHHFSPLFTIFHHFSPFHFTTFDHF